MNKDYFKIQKSTFVSSAAAQLSQFEFSDYESSDYSDESEDCFEDSKDRLSDNDHLDIRKETASVANKRPLKSPEENICTKKSVANKKTNPSN